MPKNLTIHKLSSIPYNNLNRDDTGTPKRLNQGGVLRAMLSSQSIKRAIRVDYEENSLDRSVRSANLAELVSARAQEINSALDSKEALKAAKKLIGALTKKEATEGEAGRSAWLSAEELELAAVNVANGSEENFILPGKTGALAIASFGRMFAQKQELGTEAALSVSPAVSTHQALIEMDYFSTVDDSPSEDHRGATYLGVSAYTTAIVYQTVTIDKDQLRRSWTGLQNDDARAMLSDLVRSIVYKLPRGKEHGTAPYTFPLVVLGEEQNYRTAYDFETPVQPEKEGGYATNSIKKLAAQRLAARNFDPNNFGEVAVLSGTADSKLLDDFGLESKPLDDFISAVVDWILADD